MNNNYIKILIRLLKENNLYDTKVAECFLSKLNLYSISPSQYFSKYISLLFPKVNSGLIDIKYDDVDNEYNKLIINELCEDLQNSLKNNSYNIRINNGILKIYIKKRMDMFYLRGMFLKRYNFNISNNFIIKIYNNKLNQL